MAKKLPVCPHCGSKNVTDTKSHYLCKDCKNEFGRPALSDDGISMVDAVKALRFRYGDYVSGSVWLLMGEDETGDCLYEVYDANEGGADKYADVLSAKDWKNLKKKLFETLYVTDWDKQYLPKNDGKEVHGNNAWRLSLIVSDNEEIEFHGHDAYPAYWNSLMRILDPFFDKLARD